MSIITSDEIVEFETYKTHKNLKCHYQNSPFRVYIAPNIRIENKDAIDFLKSLEDNTVDHINVDPPYNIGFDGEAGWDTFPSEEAYLE